MNLGYKVYFLVRSKNNEKLLILKDFYWMW